MKPWGFGAQTVQSFEYRLQRRNRRNLPSDHLELELKKHRGVKNNGNHALPTKITTKSEIGRLADLWINYSQEREGIVVLRGPFTPSRHIAPIQHFLSNFEHPVRIATLSASALPAFGFQEFGIGQESAASSEPAGMIITPTGEMNAGRLFDATKVAAVGAIALTRLEAAIN